MPITINGGWLDGNLIRRARKPAFCNNWRHCPNQHIQPGSYYAEMEVDPDVAGGWGMKKLCMVCAGDEARRSLLARF
jgi:hypothetical protein